VPRLRPKQKEPARFAPDDQVEAIQDLSKGGRYVTRGTRLSRSDPVVLERPDLFQVRYRLDQEVNDDGK
jgi:hypothetical protein